MAPHALADESGSLQIGSTTTESKPQSKVWYHDGRWFGIFLDTQDHYIHRLDNDQWVKLTSNGYVHEQNAAKVDALWNGTRLLVLVGHSSGSQYMEFTYDAATRTYNRVSGFPVNLSLGAGAGWANLAQDSTGKVWAITRISGDIRVFWTTSSDHTSWSSSGFTVGTVGEDECGALCVFDGKVGAFWSDQDDDAFYFRYHVDGASETSWSSRETVDQGGGAADDHINLAVTPGNVILAATKGGEDEPGVYVRRPSSGWEGPYIISSIATRPCVVYDEANAIVHCFCTDWDDSPNRILHKEIPLSEISDLESEPTETFLGASSSLNNVTSTKQTVTNATGLLAGADANGYLHWRLRTINGNGAPQVTASASPAQGTAPHYVQFTSDAEDPNGTVVSYAWTFGDGGTSTAANPSHTFSSAGLRTVRLVVTDDDGNTGEDTIEISTLSQDTQVPGADIAKINYQPSNVTTPSGYIADLGLTYTETRGYGWDEGMATESRDANPDVRLDTYAYIENEDSPATWNYDITNGQYFVTVVCGSPAWSGLHKVVLEGTTVIDSVFTDSEEFVAAEDQLVTVADGAISITCGGAAGGTKKTKICYVIIKEATSAGSAGSPPTADAQASVTSGDAPLEIDFTGSGTDSDGTIVSWSWAFDDGGTSSLQSPSHTYATPGNYTARLEVTDNQGNTGVDTIDITVSDPPPPPSNEPPTASANASVTSGDAALEVDFTGSGSDTDGTIVSWSWTFGDGGTSTQQDPTHTYTEAGNYTAILEVTDDDGATATDAIAIVVSEPPPSGGGGGGGPGDVIAQINFQPSNVTTPSGYLADLGQSFTTARNYGWSSAVDVQRKAANLDIRLETYAYIYNGTPRNWEYALTNGTYYVTVVAGSSVDNGIHTIALEGTTVINAVATSDGEFVEVTDYQVQVTDGRLTIRCGGATGSKKTKICYVIIRASD
jgi:PKD repeat protein